MQREQVIDIDEDSNLSTTRKGVEVDPVELEFPVEKLYEYQWPPTKAGEFFLLQEQVCQYLEIKSFHRKFPELERRPISLEEREYLKEQGVVTEMQCDLGLIALKTEDICQIMAENFPHKYQEYLRMVHEKERKKIIEQQEAQMAVKNGGKVASYIKKAIKDASEYNSHLNQERKEERCSYFDMQTQIIQVPRKKTQIINKRKRNRYPVALMPGQFQEYYKMYTSEELRLLPLGTLISHEVSSQKKPTDEHQNGADAEASHEVASLRSFSQHASDDEGESVSDSDSQSDTEASPAKKRRGKQTPTKRNKNQSGIRNDPFCGICLKGPEMNKKGLPEDLVYCAFCENSGHPSCLDMSRQLVKVIRTYPWQCMECKTCTLCSNPHDEEHMMFCDHCDRGYHSYCVGLKNIPNGRWVCDKCGKCASCLTRQPTGDGTPGKWRQEFTQPRDESDPEFLQNHCYSCSRLFRLGHFCPVCLKVYRNDEPDCPMVCCDFCDRWIHTDCDGIDEKRYQELSKDRSSSYKCILCRGEKEERMDAFHKLNRD